MQFKDLTDEQKEMFITKLTENMDTEALLDYAYEGLYRDYESSEDLEIDSDLEAFNI
jgi:peptide methionine sulfoxide reductase MsrB